MNINELAKVGLERFPAFNSPCDESMFTVVSHLINTWFDVITLQLFMARSLANSLKFKNRYAIYCLHMFKQSSMTNNELLSHAKTLISQARM